MEHVLAEKKLTSVRRWLEFHISKLKEYRQQIEKLRGDAER
jgi:hypothetical protein